MLRQRDGENDGGSGRNLISSNSRVFEVTNKARKLSAEDLISRPKSEFGNSSLLNWI
jgi:hypothetical protein